MHKYTESASLTRLIARKLGQTSDIATYSVLHVDDLTKVTTGFTISFRIGFRIRFMIGFRIGFMIDFIYDIPI